MAVERVEDRVYHGHGGGIHGFASHISFNMPTRTGVVLLANVWPTTGVYAMGKEVMEVLLTGSAPSTSADPELDLPAVELPPGHLGPYTGYFVANPGIPAGIDYRGGDLWITAPAGEGLAIESGEPRAFVLRGGRGAGERAEFDPGRESISLGGWLYKRVSA